MWGEIAGRSVSEGRNTVATIGKCYGLKLWADAFGKCCYGLMLPAGCYQQMLSASSMDAVIRPPDPHRPLGNIIGELMCSMWLENLKFAYDPGWTKVDRLLALLTHVDRSGCLIKWLRLNCVDRNQLKSGGQFVKIEIKKIERCYSRRWSTAALGNSTEPDLARLRTLSSEHILDNEQLFTCLLAYSLLYWAVHLSTRLFVCLLGYSLVSMAVSLALALFASQSVHLSVLSWSCVAVNDELLSEIIWPMVDHFWDQILFESKYSSVSYFFRIQFFKLHPT